MGEQKNEAMLAREFDEMRMGPVDDWRKMQRLFNDYIMRVLHPIFNKWAEEAIEKFKKGNSEST